MMPTFKSHDAEIPKTPNMQKCQKKNMPKGQNTKKKKKKCQNAKTKKNLGKSTVHQIGELLVSKLINF